MVNIISNRLENIKNSNVKAIILKGTNKVFCAGGDLKVLYDEIKSGRFELAKEFFKKEFEMDYRLSRIKIPTIALLNGFTFGGGMGLAMGARYRISNETLSMAMPETAIGFFPDVGSTYYLTSTPPHKNIGIYLGLTSEKINAADALYCGFITHYVSSLKMKDLELELESKNISKSEYIEEILQKYVSQPTMKSNIKDNLNLIIECFGFDTVEEIISKLEEKIVNGSENDRKWCRKTLDTLKSKSPTSLKIALAALKLSKEDNENIFKVEYRIAVRLIKSHDFLEGVRAILVDKDRKPKWNPQNLNEISDDYVRSFFDKLEDEEEWKDRI